MAAKGKWAQGIPPRNFYWIMKDRLAVSERPGGYGQNHRRVRRQEEIIWIREQGFNYVISMIPAAHNLHNYDELGVNWRHRGFENTDEPAAYLVDFYPELRDLLARGEKLLIHADNLSDAVCGTITGYLIWAGMIARGPEAVTLTERMVKRQLGPFGRELVRVAAELPNAAPSAATAFLDVPKSASEVADEAARKIASLPAPTPVTSVSAEKAPARTASAKKTAKKEPAARTAPAKKAVVKKAAEKKAAPTEAPAKKAPAKKAPAKKAPAKRSGSKG